MRGGPEKDRNVCFCGGGALRLLSSDSSGQLDIFWHDGDFTWHGWHTSWHHQIAGQGKPLLLPGDTVLPLTGTAGLSCSPG